MWQVEGEDTKWWMPIWQDMGAEEADVFDALLEASLLVLNISKFREAAFNCRGKKPKTERLPKGVIIAGRGNTLARVAQYKKLKCCEATKYRPIVDESDFDDCYVYHLAFELDVLSAKKE